MLLRKEAEPAKNKEEVLAGGGTRAGSSDVVSEMKKWRLRLEEECRQELAAMDQQFQMRAHQLPETGARPGSAPSQRKELQGANPVHSRGSSDASDQSVPAEANHKREYSLPVSLEPPASHPNSGNPGAEKVHRKPPQSTHQAPPIQQPLPALSLNGERTIAANNNNNNKGFSTPPPIRSPPAYTQPVFQSFRQGNHAPRAVPGTQFARTSSGSEPNSGWQQQQQQQGFTQSYDFSSSSSSDLPIHVGGTHYSTLVVKGRKSRHGPSSSSVDGSSEQQQQQQLFQPSGESSFYDRLGPHLVDQPEQKAVPLGTSQSSQQQQQPQQTQSKVGTSHQPAHLPARNSTLQGTHTPHSKLETRTSVPLLPAPPPLAGGAPASNGGAVVHPEVIQPYMSTQEVKMELKKYVPFADKKRKSVDSANIPEQTWC